MLKIIICGWSKSLILVKPKATTTFRSDYVSFSVVCGRQHSTPWTVIVLVSGLPVLDWTCMVTWSPTTCSLERPSLGWSVGKAMLSLW